MLVLSRKENEAIVIDGHIKVIVVEIRGDKIRLGIEAPRQVSVWREELVTSVAERELLANESQRIAATRACWTAIRGSAWTQATDGL
jgi:carbon storage regulator